MDKIIETISLQKPGTEYFFLLLWEKCVTERDKTIRIYQAQNLAFIVRNVYIYYFRELKIHYKPFKVFRSSFNIFLSVWTHKV